MEGFTLSLALMDAIPVLCFGASMIMIASKFSSPLFIIGAVLSTLAGCFKVAWKMILGTSKKDVKWLNKGFVPMQSAGWLLMLVSLIIGFKKIDWSGVWSAVTGLPSLILFIIWILAMCAMVWYRKKYFKKDDARSNWIAQSINCTGQISLLLAIILA